MERKNVRFTLEKGVICDPDTPPPQCPAEINRAEFDRRMNELCDEIHSTNAQLEDLHQRVTPILEFVRDFEGVFRVTTKGATLVKSIIFFLAGLGVVAVWFNKGTPSP